MNLFDQFTEYLIRRAKKTPYTHIGDYMERYWLVPFKDNGESTWPQGCRPVPFRESPLAWLLQKLGVAVRIHIIKRSDEAVLHDHPWDFISVILRGGYYDCRPRSKRDRLSFTGYAHTAHGQVVDVFWRPVGTVTRLKTGEPHFLLLPKDMKLASWYGIPERVCVTLFICFRKKQSWGFFEQGWPGPRTPWRERVKRMRDRNRARYTHSDGSEVESTDGPSS